jgi:hypothetical protein
MDIARLRRGPPTREELTEMQNEMTAMQKDYAELKELLVINTELTSDIRAILRSSKIFLTFIKGVGAFVAAVLAILAAWKAFKGFGA